MVRLQAERAAVVPEVPPDAGHPRRPPGRLPQPLRVTLDEVAVVLEPGVQGVLGQHPQQMPDPLVLGAQLGAEEVRPDVPDHGQVAVLLDHLLGSVDRARPGAGGLVLGVDRVQVGGELLRRRSSLVAPSVGVVAGVDRGSGGTTGIRPARGAVRPRPGSGPGHRRAARWAVMPFQIGSGVGVGADQPGSVGQLGPDRRVQQPAGRLRTAGEHLGQVGVGGRPRGTPGRVMTERLATPGQWSG